MSDFFIILSVLAIHVFAWMTPGPLFVLIIRNSLIYSRKAGLWTAVGIALGNAVHITYVATGIALLISSSPTLSNIITYLGVGYLSYLGVKTLLARSQASDDFDINAGREDLSTFQAVQTGFLTNILSPKASLFFASIFAGVLAKGVATWVVMTLAIAMPLNSLLMATVLSLVFTHTAVRRFYFPRQRVFNTALGLALLLLAGLILVGGPIAQREVVQPNLSFSPDTSSQPHGFSNPSPMVIESSQQANVAQPSSSASVSIPSHYFQSFNNCGPASLAMMLSHFEIIRTQQQLGDELRPYQLTNGDNDDKSVTLEELANKAEEFGLVAYHRPAGDIELLKSLTANGLPVLTRTWTQVNEDIGHYRVVKGYDDNRQVIIQDDSLQGKDLPFSYTDFSLMWEKFGYEYLVLAEPDQTPVVEAILGEYIDERVAWLRARDIALEHVAANPDDIYARFNLSVIYYELGEYQQSVAEFEAVESQLPARTLWYQIEPLLAYQQLGRYDELLPRIDRILENGNRAFSELYQIRGEIYLDRGDAQAARREFERALFYNENFQPAQRVLEGMG